MRCLECHTAIPIQELVAQGASEDGQPPLPVDPEVDNASIQNLPRIERCRTCHEPGRVSNRCTTCHLFHPDKDRSNLLLYVEPGEGRTGGGTTG